MTWDNCQANGLTENHTELTCDLPESHKGKHLDRLEGYEFD